MDIYEQWAALAKNMSGPEKETPNFTDEWHLGNVLSSGSNPPDSLLDEWEGSRLELDQIQRRMKEFCLRNR